MIQRTFPPTSQRVSVLMTVVALHAALLAIFFANRNTAPEVVVEPGVLSLVSIARDIPAQLPPPPPILPSKVVDEIKRLTEQALTIDPDSQALASPSGACATLEVVTKALIDDPSAVAAIVQAPPETRSITEAIVMWNVGWSNAASSLDSPLIRPRAVVEQSLDAVEAGCLDEQIAGPRLVPIPVPDSQRTMFLVFGSGTWTWRELVTDPVAAPDPMFDNSLAKPWYDFDWL